MLLPRFLDRFDSELVLLFTVRFLLLFVFASVLEDPLATEDKGFPFVKALDLFLFALLILDVSLPLIVELGLFLSTFPLVAKGLAFGVFPLRRESAIVVFLRFDL